jgi:phytoene synthase
MIAQAAESLGELLSPVERLALVYAPARVRPLWLGYFALESRLARAARVGAEPVLAQIKLAWWREQLAAAGADSAREPVLALLESWRGERGALVDLVDGWEASEIGEDDGVRLRAARVEAMLALARLAGSNDASEAIRRATLDWLDGEAGGPILRLSRTMRPLAVLRGVALKGEGARPLSKLLAAVRSGLVGR